MQNPRNIVIGPLNVNCLKNKFEALEELIQNRVDVCFFSETIIDETFPNQQFKIFILINYSAKTKIVIMELFWVLLINISPPTL